MKKINYLLLLTALLPAVASAFSWNDLWQTQDQQALKLLQRGNAGTAAQVFKDKNWQAVSHYRSGNYKEALKQFEANKTSDGQYNSGNAAAFMGKYQDAITAYDKAIALNPNNQDAVTNRDIVKKLLQEQQQQKQQNQNKKNQNDKQNQDQKSQDQKNQDQKTQDQKKQDQASQNAKQDQNKQDKSNQQNNSQNQNQQNKPDNKDQNNPQQNQPSNSNQQKSSRQPQDEYAPAANNRNQQEENNKQLLRRLSDDPGGLLQQKFLRDYARRHGADDNDNQGVTQ